LPINTPSSPDDSSHKKSISKIFSRSTESFTHRNYLILWLSKLFLMFGIQMQMVARGYLTYDLTEDPGLVGIVIGGSAIPMLLLSLFGGVLSDRINKKILIQIGQILAALIAFAIAFLIINEMIIWQHLLVGASLQGVGWAFLAPARQTIIPQILPKRLISNGIAMDGALMGVTSLLAPAVAGILYAIIGPAGVYVCITVIISFSVIICSLLNYVDSNDTKLLDGQKNISATYFTGRLNSYFSKFKIMLFDIKVGLIYAKTNQIVSILLLLSLTYVILVMPFRFLLPVVIREVYFKESEALGLLLSVIGLGSLLSSILIAIMGPIKRGFLQFFGILIAGCTLVLVSIFPYYSIGLILMFFLGIGESARMVLANSLLLENCEKKFQGRVMSLRMLIFGLQPIGTLPSGFAMDYFGARKVVAFLGATMILATLFFASRSKKLISMD
tara:strand:- start:47789 stop:49120 length:1332 start_codon:yes stop_codon:yes gene_type:complete